MAGTPETALASQAAVVIVTIATVFVRIVDGRISRYPHDVEARVRGGRGADRAFLFMLHGTAEGPRVCSCRSPRWASVVTVTLGIVWCCTSR